MSTQLPYRFRESSFRRYEEHIARAVLNFPKPTTFYPLQSTETFSCRMRDAVRSLLNNGWKTYVDVEKLRTIVDDLSVAVGNDTVIVGPLGALEGVPSQSAMTNKPVVEYKDPSEDLLKVIIQMHHFKLKDTPTRVSFSPSDDKSRDLTIEDWEKNYDIAIEKQTDNSFLIL